MKNVEFHFPNAKVSLVKVQDDTADTWEHHVTFNRTFVAEHTNPYTRRLTRYVINGELVTYMTIEEWKEVGF